MLIFDKVLSGVIKARKRYVEYCSFHQAKSNLKRMEAVDPKVTKEADIVIIRSDAIGDFIIWLSSAQCLRQYYSDRKITLICRMINKELAEKTLLFDEVIAIDSGIDDILDKICGLKANTLIQPMYSRNNFSEQIVSAIKCDNKIAIDGDATNYSKASKKHFDKQYTKLYKTADSEMHELERNKIFVEKLTGLTVKLDPFELIKILDLQGAKHVDEYFVVNLGASSKVKQWATENFVKCVKYIQEKTSLKCVLIGNEAERELATKFLKLYNQNVLDMTGKTTLIEMIEIISDAELVLCNDTSTVHIASASRIPCVCVAPGMNYPRFIPYPSELENERARPLTILNYSSCFGCNNDNRKFPRWQCILNAHKGKNYACLSSVSARDVICELEKWDIFGELCEKNE